MIYRNLIMEKIYKEIIRLSSKQPEILMLSVSFVPLRRQNNLQKF